MATPPSQQDINSFIEGSWRTLAYPEARKRLLREYFFQELKDIEEDKNISEIGLDLKITRLAKVVGGILTQLP